jgi:hypothetical protein
MAWFRAAKCEVRWHETRSRHKSRKVFDGAIWFHATKLNILTSKTKPLSFGPLRLEVKQGGEMNSSFFFDLDFSTSA